MVALTIGMATYNDFDGVYFTIQALRMYQDLADTELLVIDNYGCEHTKKFVEAWTGGGRYIHAPEAVGTAAPRDRVFREARGEAVLCCDSHVLFEPGVIARLKAYYRDHPDTRDLLQGPIVYDDLHNISTHFEPVWRAQMWGTWATDERGRDPEGEPFDIPMQGLGAFSCRRAVWPGFNPRFRGFGGEEGYIHEKVRQRGGRTLCLPWLRWVHRFGRPAGVPYPLTVEDKLRNYLIGHEELGLPIAPALEHFAEHLPEGRVEAILEEVLREQASAAAGERMPLVSCICATYNRAPDYLSLLEEAIESFLRQDYPNKELIILNDTPGQELVCDAPGVRVVNVAERYPTLGAKHNAAIGLAHGELIAPWDDDDISLPWRLSRSVERLGTSDYFNPKRHWYMNRDELRPEPVSNVGHNLSLFTRAAWEQVGGYPSVPIGTDQAMDRALRASVGCVGMEDDRGKLAPDELFYLYRWGVSAGHLSMARSDTERAENWQRIGALPIEPGQFRLHPHWRQDYVALTRERAMAINEAEGRPGPTLAATRGDERRAVVCFVEDQPHLIQQALALRTSLHLAQSPDTDLVVMGPEPALDQLPDDLVKIVQQPAADDPVWGGYRVINPVVALNGVGAEQLDRYTHLLRTDADTFLTPAWNQFDPAAFTVGQGAYATDGEVTRRIREIAAEYGLTHRGITNLGASWYGPTPLVRRVAAFTELLTKHLLTHHFASDHGQWPGWYRGVAVRYAAEIAINHVAPDVQCSELLDASSTSAASILTVAHIHCQHTDETFSKHAFIAGRYTLADVQQLDLSVIRDYCLALSFESLPSVELVVV
jgi:glycosyltransferase involved in cell wall biosynthesis